MTNRKQLREPEVLELIHVGGEDAQAILLERLPGAEKRFKRLDRALIEFLAHIRLTFPDAKYYTGSGGFNLLLGRPHSSKHVAQAELVALSGAAQIGDGDF